MDKLRYIMLHHPAAVSYSPEQCHKDHLKNGWDGAGYNEYIRKDGTVYIMRGDHIGAQCHGMNSISYGICCEGNYDIERKMPTKQYNSLLLRIRYHIDRFPNFLEITPHKKFANTSCPGIFFPFDKIVNEIKGEKNIRDTVSAIELWEQAGVITSPEYWIKNAVRGKTVSGSNASALLIKTANYVKSRCKNE